jgi:hypothetical protein
MAAAAAVASRDDDRSLDDAFGRHLFPGAARRALVGGAKVFRLIGEESIRLKFRHGSHTMQPTCRSQPNLIYHRNG